MTRNRARCHSKHQPPFEMFDKGARARIQESRVTEDDVHRDRQPLELLKHDLKGTGSKLLLYLVRQEAAKSSAPNRGRHARARVIAA